MENGKKMNLWGATGFIIGKTQDGRIVWQGEFSGLQMIVKAEELKEVA